MKAASLLRSPSWMWGEVMVAVVPQQRSLRDTSQSQESMKFTFVLPSLDGRPEMSARCKVVDEGDPMVTIYLWCRCRQKWVLDSANVTLDWGSTNVMTLCETVHEK